MMLKQCRHTSCSRAALIQAIKCSEIYVILSNNVNVTKFEILFNISCSAPQAVCEQTTVVCFI